MPQDAQSTHTHLTQAKGMCQQAHNKPKISLMGQAVIVQ